MLALPVVVVPVNYVELFSDRRLLFLFIYCIATDQNKIYNDIIQIIDHSSNLSDECGHLLTIRSRTVAINR